MYHLSKALVFIACLAFTLLSEGLNGWQVFALFFGSWLFIRHQPWISKPKGTK